MKKENWELEWIKFVREVMCPARCGRLRFKVKKLIQGIRDKQKEEIKKMIKKMKIEDAEKSDNFSFLHSKGYNKALEDILEELNK